jgi:uncharacterized protein YacL
METIVLGPLLIPYKWLYLLLSGITTYFAVKITLKEDKHSFNVFMDELTNALIVWFLVYKFSLLMFRPRVLFERPIEILYFTGGSKGFILGTIVAVFLFIWKAHKNRWNILSTLQTLVYTAITFVICYWGFHTIFALF